MPRTSSAWDFELINTVTNEVTGLMLARPKGRSAITGQHITAGDGEPATIDEVIAAAFADRDVERRLTPVLKQDWSGGVGVDYHEAPGVYTRTPGFACNAGAVTDVTVQGTFNSLSPIVAIAEFASDLYFAQQGTGAANTGRVMVSTGGIGALANSLNLGANQYVRDLIVADDGSGNSRLFCSSTDSAGNNGRIHDLSGGAWNSTAVGTFGVNGRNRMQKVQWQTADGSSGWRLVSISGFRTIAYTKPDTDPRLMNSWVEGVRLGTAYALAELPAARHHIYATARDGLFDLDGMGNSPNLTNYLDRQVQTGTGVAAEYLNNYVYMSSGRGIERIYVGTNGALQETPGQCAPGWGTPAENEWRGYCTAMFTDQGYLGAAILNPTTGKTGIFWGIDRDIVGVKTRNPLAWYGPEVTVNYDYKVTRAMTSGAAQDLRLWIAAQSISTGYPILGWASLPIAGSPLQDLISAGPHRFCTHLGYGIWQPYAYMVLSDRVPTGEGDPIATSNILQYSLATRGLDGNSGANTRLVVESRADPAPGYTAWPTGQTVSIPPLQTIFPSGPVTGQVLEDRITFYSPLGTATPAKVAVLDAVRRDVWKTVPTVGTVITEVEYGSGVLNLHGHEDDRDPDVVSATLIALTTAGRVTLRDRQDKRWTSVLNQILDRTASLTDTGTYGKQVRAKIEVRLLTGPL